jgi:hypothetical protein
MIILFEDINENQKGEAHHRNSLPAPPIQKTMADRSVFARRSLFAALSAHMKAIFNKDSSSSPDEMGHEKIAS